MKIGIACGGTGGHIFPGLATAEVLRARGHEVAIWIGGKKFEKEALAGWDGTVVVVPSCAFPARPGFSSLKALGMLWRAFRQCRREMRAMRPDVFLAMGGYTSVAPVLAARELAVPIVLHEANVIPGRANRFLMRWAKTLALGFDETRSRIKHPDMILTGIPLRKVNPCPGRFGENTLKPHLFTILVMGGSRGARALNETVTEAILRLHAAGKAIQVIHLTGTDDEEKVRQKYGAAGAPHFVAAFLQNMFPAYQRSSLAICRSGASTCAELGQYGVPALLVPYPHATAQHQLANAQAMKKSGMADVIEEKQLTAEWLEAYICAIMTDNDKLPRMKKASLQYAEMDAAGKLADVVLGNGVF